MKKNKEHYLRNHFLLTSVVALFFCLLVGAIFAFSHAPELRPPERKQLDGVIKLLKEAPKEKRQDVLSKFSSAVDGIYHLELVDEDKHRRPPGPPRWKDGHKKPPPISIFGRRGPPPHHRGHIRIDDQVLVVKLDEGFRKHRRPPVHPSIFAAIVVVIVIIITSALSTILTYRSFGKFHRNARTVIDRIKSGNFSARFEISRSDEIGSSMFVFNEMAEEIEKYVNKIRETESTRIRLLQELAHDLRTPIASLKNTITTLHMKKNRMSEEQQDDFFSLANHEMDYFEKLVEDLLFLAKMSEPKYSLEEESVDISEIFNDEVCRLGAILPESYFFRNIETDNTIIKGDRHLLVRLIRNAVENASSFAVNRVSVTLSSWKGVLKILIIDDGPGFSIEALRDFGKRKVSRYIADQNKGERVSVGLGSVIMQSIVKIHDGELAVSNVILEGKKVGGCVEISLPQNT